MSACISKGRPGAYVPHGSKHGTGIVDCNTHAGTAEVDQGGLQRLAPSHSLGRARSLRVPAVRRERSRNGPYRAAEGPGRIAGTG